MKKLLISLLKIGISLAIVGYLLYDAQQNRVFDDLRNQPKQWGLLVAAFCCCAAAVTLTMIRWHYLVRALEMPFRLKDAFRLGFLGYLFNLAPMGIVGGDLLKAVMLAREQPGRRAQAVATVFIDRIIGLYMLFVVASAAILLTGFGRGGDAAVRWACQVTLCLAALGALMLMVLLTPGVTNGRLSRWLSTRPRVGPTIESLIVAVRMYRQKAWVLAVAAAMSVGVHLLFATGIFLIASGLFTRVLTLSQHYVVAPLSAATGVLPLPVGPFEYVLDRLYAMVPLADGSHLATGRGLVVALGYRIITVLIAMVGVCYYLTSRREVAEVIHEEEEALESPAPIDPAPPEPVEVRSA